MSITAVIIRNFRSIAYFNQKVQDLNIFVGQNDEGKSNILRALDLFFNGEGRHGYELEWARDYCAFAPERLRKAEEISMALEITPPKHFKNSNPLMWRKVWRKKGLHADTLKHRDGTAISPYSKLPAFARSIRYDYIPAIKGEEYFQGLMASLHDMLEATVEEEVRSASQNFTKTINDNTKPILEGILKQLELKSTIALPTSLRDLFAQLEFMSESANQPFSLAQRGDGIKVRHIPIVLRWLADQANALSAPGRPKTATVWGYEEPENNLELRRCFELAQQFVDGADTIQTFVTTHSPAFYSVCRHSDPDRVKLFLVQKEVDPPTTSVRPLTGADLTSLDLSMGLLDLLEPHFRKAREELERLREHQNRLQDTSKPTLFCEGPSDKALIEATLKAHFADLSDKLVVRCSDHAGGGHEWVADMVIAWSFSRPQARAVGLFDRDNAAQESRRKLDERVKDAGKQYVAWSTVKPGDELKACCSKNVIVPWAIEEVLPREIWDYAEKQEWLEDRTNPIDLYGFNRTDISFAEHMNNLLQDEHHRRLALRKVKSDPETKAAFARYVIEITADAKSEALAQLKPTVEECLKGLSLIEKRA